MSPDRVPPVGWTVQFWPGGDPHNLPVAAIVTGNDPSGTLALETFLRGGGDSVPRKSVRHIDDPFLDEHPTARREFGAWDWVPGLVFKPPKPTGEMKPEEIARLVMDLHGQGLTPGKIALKIAKPGLTKTLIAGIIDKYEAEPSAKK